MTLTQTVRWWKEEADPKGSDVVIQAMARETDPRVWWDWLYEIQDELHSSSLWSVNGASNDAQVDESEGIERSLRALEAFHDWTRPNVQWNGAWGLLVTVSIPKGIDQWEEARIIAFWVWCWRGLRAGLQAQAPSH